MTGRDPFPFGKHKGTPLDDVDESYIAWLETQSWWTEAKGRWASYRTYYRAVAVGEDDELAEPIERANIQTERVLLSDTSQEFKDFWARSYGERLRRDGEILYIAHLRVAITAWRACEAHQARQSSPSVSTTPTGPITLE